jgi:hypothetical protein
VQTLRETGSAVIFTGLSLSIGVATWVFSPLQFQADMGLLLTFMFIMNMLGAIIVLPLAAVSVFANAAMALLGIGLKLSTLPITALGVGIGVDYGIYKFSRLSHYIRLGYTLDAAYVQTLRETGSAVIFTGLSLSIGVATWVFSPLQFQADMGLLLTFMFIMNMLGAIIVLPAIIGVMDIVAPQKHVGPPVAAVVD